MAGQLKRWADFWKDEREGFFEIMKLSTSVFADRFDAHFGTNSDHKILDYGCGPGFFIDCEVGKRTTISGIDINSYFVAECKRKYPDLPVFQIPTDYDELEIVMNRTFGEQRFDFIVLLSVCQYFESTEQLQKMITLLGRYLAPGGRLVFADVLTPGTSSLRDTLALLRHCLIHRRMPGFARFVKYLLLSEYRSVSRKEGLHTYTDDDFKRSAGLAALEYSRVDNLTLHPTRTNYVITKMR
jgi:SAM-dependent methyltransferase